MDWKTIETQPDAASLIETFRNFHDGCIREAHLWTGHWVNSDRSMSVDAGLDNRIRILIQCSWPKATAIELWFEEITRFNLVPAPENYDSIIFNSVLLVRDGIIYWSPEDRCELPETLLNESELGNDYTWITARKLRWREVDLLGQELRYGAKGE